MKIQNARGTYDLFGRELRLREGVLNAIFELAYAYQFKKIETPIFEHTELFVRAVGEETDVVSKEMYTFLDKKERSITLRPELTAPVVRSFIQNKMYASKLNERFCYYGPAFRYERPQAGRFRQFHQFGVESFNLNNPMHDAEVITLGYAILKHFNINATLKINTLGLGIDRTTYIEALKSHMFGYMDSLCEDCKNRLETNTLRILDCKVCQQTEALLTAPKLMDHLSTESITRFNKVLKTLDMQNISYEIDNKLVRGLDYYNDTVFEFEYTSSEGRTLTILGGGRYDNLVETIGGPATDAFGFGIGIERLVDAIMDIEPTIIEEYQNELDIYYMPLCDQAIDVAFNSMNKLRYHGFKCDMSMEVRSFKANFKKAEKLKSIYAVIIGEDEIKNNVVTIKNLITKDTATVPLSSFESDLIEEANHASH